MATDNLMVDPLTYNSTTNDYGIALGSTVKYNHATYGEMTLRFVKFLDAVTYQNGHVVNIADATGLWYVSNDVAGGTTIGTAGDAAVSQIFAGIVINSASYVPTTGSYGYVMIEGIHPVKSDDGISQGHRLVSDAVDGGADTMADGEEEQVWGVALADDNDTTDRVLARVFAR